MDAVLLFFAIIGMIGTTFFVLYLAWFLVFSHLDKQLSKSGRKKLGGYETSPFDTTESEGEAIKPRRV